MTTKIENRTLLPAQRLNFIDRTIAFVNPSYGVRAMVARTQLHQFGYNDVPERRGRAPGLSTQAGSETWSSNRDRLKAIADARDACQYDWIGGVLAKVVLYVCGTCAAKSTIGEPEIDQAYDDYFHAWCGDTRNEDGTTRCDITGRHRFLRQVQMAFLAFLVDGDHGLLEIAPEASPTVQLDEAGQPIPGTGEFCIQNIEADRIGSPMEATTMEDYIGGVKVDTKTGRVQFYRVFRRTRTNQYVDPQEIAPADFIHIFDPDRSDEYRGRSKLIRCLNDLRDIREWIEAEKMAGKTQSQWAAMIGTKDPFKGTGPDAWTGTTANGTPTQDAIWGKILKMAEGESFSMMSPSARPSGAFMAFVQMLIRKMAAALNLPYGFLWDLSQLGGVTARIEVQGALRQIQYWQENVLTSLILHRIREKVIAQGIARGEIPSHPAWRKQAEWHFGPWITTDTGYEMQSDVMGMNTGIIPISAIAGKYGMSPFEVFTSNAVTANEALNVGSTNMIPVEVFAKGLFPDITQQKAAFMQPTPMPPPPPGSMEALGEKGVSELIELLQAVAEGKMDRDAAINTLGTVFHVPPEIAGAMVPQEPSPEDLEALHPKPAAPGTTVNKPAKKE